MTDITPEDFLPENFEQFQKQIPGLRISDRLAAGNPLKKLLSHIENKQNNGILFKLICLAWLAYLTFFAGSALYQKHPSAPAMMIMLFSVYAFAVITWKKSPITPYCLPQITLFFKTYSVINRALKQAKEQNTGTKISFRKKIKQTFFNRFFIIANIGKIERLSTEEEKHLLKIRKFVDQVFIDRFLLFLGFFAYIILYCQNALYLSNPGIEHKNAIVNFINDAFLASPSFSSQAFLNFMFLNIICIMFLIYGGNIFAPYQWQKIRKFIKNKPCGKFKKFILRPIIKIIYFLLMLYVFMTLCYGIPVFYSDFELSGKWIPVLAVFGACAMFFHFSSIAAIIVLRQLALFLNYFCKEKPKTSSGEAQKHNIPENSPKNQKSKHREHCR